MICERCKESTTRLVSIEEEVPQQLGDNWHSKTVKVCMSCLTHDLAEATEEVVG